MKKLYLLLFYGLIVSCTDVHIQDEHIRIMERQDHEECQAEGTSYSPEITREVYWRCRLSVVNRRIKDNNAKHGYVMLEKGELKKVKLIMENRVERANNAVLLTLDPEPDVKDHETCILRGYAPDSINEKIVQDYYECRRELVIARTVPEPFGKYSYELLEAEARDIPKLRNIKDVILEKEREYDKEKGRLDINSSTIAVEASDLVNKYPNCAIYNVRSANFKECVKQEEEAKNCFDLIPSKIAKRKLNDTIFCEKQSVEQFPDSLAIVGEISTVETKSIFGSKKIETVASGPKLSRLEIIKLREEFVKTCSKQREEKLLEYMKFLPLECKKLSKESINVD